MVGVSIKGCATHLSRAFRRDAGGSVALVLAMTTIPLCAVGGLAIDFANAARVKNGLQKSLDASVLAAAKAQSDLNVQTDAVIKAYVTENFTAVRGLAPPTVTSSIDANGLITATATISTPTYFMSLFGWNQIPLQATSEGAFGSGFLEIVMVLDNTGSMSGSKLDGLKAAAKGLLDTVYAAPKAAEKVKVGVVPFAQYVNVGVANRNASYMNVPLDSSTTTNQCWNTYPNATSSNCMTVTSTCHNDGVPYSCTSQQCTWDYGAPVEVCGPVTSNSTWYGCAGSRSYPLDVDTSADFTTRVPGVMNVSCPSTLTRLSNDVTALKSQVDAMVATGETFIAPGVTWGWRVLSPDAPFADGASPTQQDNKKIMILMTDGANTMSPVYPEHYGSDQTLSNNLTAEVCTNVKKKGVTIFTVSFGVTDANANALLAACASGPPYSYSAATTSELYGAFQSIGKSLSAVRITK